MPMPLLRASRVLWRWIASPARTSRPASGRWTPATICIKVDFPAPFSPTTAWTNPALAEGDVLERFDAGEGLGDGVDFEKRGHISLQPAAGRSAAADEAATSGFDRRPEATARPAVAAITSGTGRRSSTSPSRRRCRRRRERRPFLGELLENVDGLGAHGVGPLADQSRGVAVLEERVRRHRVIGDDHQLAQLDVAMPALERPRTPRRRTSASRRRRTPLKVGGPDQKVLDDLDRPAEVVVAGRRRAPKPR